MQRQRGDLVPLGEGFAGHADGPVKKALQNDLLC